MKLFVFDALTTLSTHNEQHIHRTAPIDRPTGRQAGRQRILDLMCLRIHLYLSHKVHSFRVVELNIMWWLYWFWMRPDIECIMWFVSALASLVVLIVFWIRCERIMHTRTHELSYSRAHPMLSVKFTHNKVKHPSKIQRVINIKNVKGSLSHFVFSQHPRNYFPI